MTSSSSAAWSIGTTARRLAATLGERLRGRSAPTRGPQTSSAIVPERRIASGQPHPDTRQFEVAVFKELDRRAACQSHVHILESCRNPAGGGSAEAFFEFYACCMYARRNGDVARLAQLIKQADDRHLYRDFGAYWHLKAMYHSTRRRAGDLDHARRLAAEAERIVDCNSGRCPELVPSKVHAGVRHHRAEIEALWYETHRAGSELAGADAERIGRALEWVDEAIAAEEVRADDENTGAYAKFYATRARLQALLGQFDNAEASVREAIEGDCSVYDHVRRYTDYQAILISIRLRRQMLDVARVRDDLERSQVRHIEILAFFSAVLALVLVGVQIGVEAAGGAEPSAADAFAVMLSLAGVLLVAIGALGFLLNGPQMLARTGPVVLLGFVLLAAPVLSRWITPAPGGQGAAGASRNGDAASQPAHAGTARAESGGGGERSAARSAPGRAVAEP